MKTQHIRVMSDQERNDAATAAARRHDEITLWVYSPIGTVMCCPGVIPIVKFGGGTCYTIKCPLCGTKESWWGTEDAIGRMWNDRSRFRERAFNPIVGRDYLSDYPDDSIYRSRLSCPETYMFWSLLCGGTGYEKILQERFILLKHSIKK